MRSVTVALLFATVLAARHGGSPGGFRGFGGHGGIRGPVGRTHFGHIGIRGPSYRSAYPAFGYGGLWSGYYPFGWYNAPVWSSSYGPAYPYHPTPNVTVVLIAPSGAVNSQAAYEAPPAPDPPPRVTRSVPAAKEVERPLAKESWAYLLAARNGAAWLVRNYTVADGVVRFTTTGGERKELPLANVDIAASEQWNRERGVAVQLR